MKMLILHVYNQGLGLLQFFVAAVATIKFVVESAGLHKFI